MVNCTEYDGYNYIVKKTNIRSQMIIVLNRNSLHDLNPKPFDFETCHLTTSMSPRRQPVIK